MTIPALPFMVTLFFFLVVFLLPYWGRVIEGSISDAERAYANALRKTTESLSAEEKKQALLTEVMNKGDMV